MKRNHIVPILLTVIATTLLGCEEIASDDRYLSLLDESAGDDQVRKVLVEEYTGQFCVNCPTGHAVLDEIKSLYGEQIVVVGIHAGKLSWDDTANGGLKTPDGDVYADQWHVQSYPSLIVSHQGTPIESTALWQGAVQAQTGRQAAATIAVTAHADDGGTLTVRSELCGNTAARYQLWITEDHIVAMQETTDETLPGGYDLSYTHNHVYRASINGIGGESVALTAGEKQELTHTFALDSRWNRQNLHVVAFLYDNDGVIQVEETGVIDN